MSKKVSLDEIENYIADNRDFEENENAATNIPPILDELMEENLTDKQKCYIMLYYKQKLTMEQIAEAFHVAPSTVSRTIERGRQRMLKGLQKDCLRRLLGG